MSASFLYMHPNINSKGRLIIYISYFALSIYMQNIYIYSIYVLVFLNWVAANEGITEPR